MPISDPTSPGLRVRLWSGHWSRSTTPPTHILVSSSWLMAPIPVLPVSNQPSPPVHLVVATRPACVACIGYLRGALHILHGNLLRVWVASEELDPRCVLADFVVVSTN
ncbi:hypothetical protein B0H19DRAFT_1192977 [Mycena capillaripes]|nr:hypothetical protein B0H19DRAFT_1192977 [Mycena capillaripes]